MCWLVLFHSDPITVGGGGLGGLRTGEDGVLFANVDPSLSATSFRQTLQKV